MKSVSWSIIFMLVLVATNTTFAALARGPAVVHPNHPERCYDSNSGKYYAPEESWNVDYCQEATCFRSNHKGTPKLMVSYASCGVLHVEKPCYIKDDTSLPFPGCCPQPVCPEEQETTVSSQHSLNEDDGPYQKGSGTTNIDKDFNDKENEIEESNLSFSDSIQLHKNGKLDSSGVEINYSDMKPHSKHMNKNYFQWTKWFTQEYYNGERSISSRIPQMESKESRILPQQTD